MCNIKEKSVNLRKIDGFFFYRLIDITLSCHLYKKTTTVPIYDAYNNYINSIDMNKLLTIFCMASMLAFHTSCNDSVTNFENKSVEIKTRAVNQKVKNLIQQARQGDVEAYNSLALCYRDGDGVEKSWLNMMCMYAIYSQKTGRNIEDVLRSFDEGHPFRLVFEVMDSLSFYEKTEVKLEQLKQLLPMEAKAIEAAKKLLSMEEDAETMSIIREAEAEGSQLAVMFQTAYYASAKDKTGQEEFFIRVAEKYPSFNQLLGDIYADRYRESEDFLYIQKAVECYYKADAYGMLLPKYAYILLRIHNNYGEKGLPECDEQEIERLRLLAKIKF